MLNNDRDGIPYKLTIEVQGVKDIIVANRRIRYYRLLSMLVFHNG